MWFRNLLMYRLAQDIDLDAQALETALATKPARPCESQEWSTYGFAPPLGKGTDALVQASNGFLLISARKDERILPTSVINDELRKKVDAIEESQQRKVYKKERDQLKDEIIQTLLPRAFTRSSRIFAAIAPAERLLLVDHTSAKRAEDLLSTLREAIGSLPVRPVTLKTAATATLTDWVRNRQADNEFWLSDDALLRDTDEVGSINAKHQDLTSDEIHQHLDAGKTVTRLSLAWQDKLSFVLDEGLVIRKLRFDDLLQEKAIDDAGKDADGAAQFMASFTLMMLTLREFIPTLLDAMGGEEVPTGI